MCTWQLPRATCPHAIVYSSPRRNPDFTHSLLPKPGNAWPKWGLNPSKIRVPCLTIGGRWFVNPCFTRIRPTGRFRTESDGRRGVSPSRVQLQGGGTGGGGSNIQQFVDQEWPEETRPPTLKMFLKAQCHMRARPPPPHKHFERKIFFRPKELKKTGSSQGTCLWHFLRA